MSSQTLFFDHVDHRRQQQIKPYRVVSSNRSSADILHQVHFDAYHYGSNFSVFNGHNFLVEPMDEYERLLTHIKQISNIDFIPLHAIATQPLDENKTYCGIRHDIDIDIYAALQLARIEARLGVRSTYYVLHTAPYYGHFENNIFYRNDCMLPLYQEIQSLGHEVALHTDGMLFYQSWNCDGSAAITTELAWLRENGLNIQGTVAHNFAPTYGVENFQIFQQRNNTSYMRRQLQGSNLTPDAALAVLHHNKWAPLQVLNEQALGLDYEANDLFRCRNLEYAAIRSANCWNYQKHRQQWLKDQPADDLQYIDNDRVYHLLKKIPPGKVLVLAIHPVYYGLRHDPEYAPAVPSKHQQTVHNSLLGWETYQASSLVATCLPPTGLMTHEATTHNRSNELGLLDLSFHHRPLSNSKKIMLLGGTNFHGKHISLAGHLHLTLKKLLEQYSQTSFDIINLSYPQMGFTRLFAWQQWATQHYQPDIIILGIGADEIQRSVRAFWAAETGYHPDYPAGNYLHWDGQQVICVAQSDHHSIHRRSPKIPAEIISLTDSLTVEQQQHITYLALCLQYFQQSAQPASMYLMLQECGEHLGLWQSDITEKEHVAHQQVLANIALINQSCQLPLIDPYADFLKAQDEPATHWQTRNEWNQTGHRHAATTLFKALQPQLTTKQTSGATAVEIATVVTSPLQNTFDTDNY